EMSRDVFPAEGLLGERGSDGLAHRRIAVAGEQLVQAVDVVVPRARPAVDDLGEVVEPSSSSCWRFKYRLPRLPETAATMAERCSGKMDFCLRPKSLA